MDECTSGVPTNTSLFIIKIDPDFKTLLWEKIGYNNTVCACVTVTMHRQFYVEYISHHRESFKRVWQAYMLRASDEHYLEHE
jgi:hypothetical protein